jgi:hypothetical protein
VAELRRFRIDDDLLRLVIIKQAITKYAQTKI